MPKNRKWTKRRLLQLNALHSLLAEASILNHGSGAAERILRVEKLANGLLNSDLNRAKDHASFHQFLVELAISEHRGT